MLAKIKIWGLTLVLFGACGRNFNIERECGDRERRDKQEAIMCEKKREGAEKDKKVYWHTIWTKTGTNKEVWPFLVD